MASIWLEPIVHDTHAQYTDPIKLRRPMQVQQIRVAKPPPGMLRLEFLAKNLRTPSDELITVSTVDKMHDALEPDILVQLEDPVLTNYMVVRGEYKTLSLCLEASEPTLSQERINITPVNVLLRAMPRLAYWLLTPFPILVSFTTGLMTPPLLRSTQSATHSITSLILDLLSPFPH